MSKPSVLVTGGAGYIGSHAVLALTDAGWPVAVVDDLSTGFRWAVPEEVPFYEGDVADPALLARIFAERNIRAVMHFAGSIVVPESVSDPLKYYRNNTAASRTLIEAVVEAGVPHMLFSSTAAVYGLPETSPVAESAPTLPINPYGWSKLMTERMLADAAAAHDLNYGALRYFNVAGADPGGRSGQSTAGATHLIKIAVEAALGARESVAIYGTDYPTPDGTGVRDYIHVSDLAAAHVLALEALIAAPARSITLNCGYGRGFSVREVLDAVDRVAQTTLARREAPRRGGRFGAAGIRSVADPRRVRLAAATRRPRGDRPRRAGVGAGAGPASARGLTPEGTRLKRPPLVSRRSRAISSNGTQPTGRDDESPQQPEEPQEPASRLPRDPPPGANLRDQQDQSPLQGTPGLTPASQATAIEAVVFDIGRVLVRWELRALFAKLIRDPARLEWFLENVVTERWHFQHDAGRPLDDMVPALQAAYPEWRDEIAAYRSRFLETIPGPVPGTADLLHRLDENGTPLFAITNFGTEFWESFVPTQPMLSRFRDIVVSGHERLAKPDPAIFRLAAKRFGIAPRSTLFIDDNLQNTAAARALGWHVHRFIDAPGLEANLKGRGLLRQ